MCPCLFGFKCVRVFLACGEASISGRICFQYICFAYFSIFNRKKRFKYNRNTFASSHGTDA